MDEDLEPLCRIPESWRVVTGSGGVGISQRNVPRNSSESERMSVPGTLLGKGRLTRATLGPAEIPPGELPCSIIIYLILIFILSYFIFNLLFILFLLSLHPLRPTLNHPCSAAELKSPGLERRVSLNLDRVSLPLGQHPGSCPHPTHPRPLGSNRHCLVDRANRIQLPASPQGPRDCLQLSH